MTEDYKLPNIFGPPISFTPEEAAALRKITADPLLRKLINFHLRNEYESMILARNPISAPEAETSKHMAYITGCYAMAQNICRAIPMTPEDFK